MQDSRGRELADRTPSMSQDDVLNLLNRTLENSRASVELANAILREAATELRSIQSHEAYSCAVLIRLIKRLGGRPAHGARAADDEAVATGLEPGLARLISVQNRIQQELRHNLTRVAEDRIRLRLGKILDATDQHVRRLCGTPRHSGSKAEPPDQRLTDRGLNSPEGAEGGRAPPTETP